METGYLEAHILREPRAGKGELITLSNEKICPLLSIVRMGDGSSSYTLSPCKKEGCAWWIKKIERVPPNYEEVITGGCAIEYIGGSHS